MAREAALSYNALSYNALSYNALSYNALSYNALSYNALSYNSLAAIQDSSSAGTLSRQLLQYTVGCALNASQSFSFSWVDAQGNPQSATYAGQLGLAPGWANGPLTHRNEQELVSACLAARTNYFGVTVAISVRGEVEALLDNTSAAELAAYPYVEGAFWGNLFAPTPYLNACHNPATVAHSRADQRDCATGYPDGRQLDSCGMINPHRPVRPAVRVVRSLEPALRGLWRIPERPDDRPPVIPLPMARSSTGR